MAISQVELANRYQRLRRKFAERDKRFLDVQAVMSGRMADIYPDLFPDGPMRDPIVANMIEIAARDVSEVMAPLPSFNCSSASMASDRARAFADKRGKIVAHYIDDSNLQTQMYTAAYKFAAYGAACGQVEIDTELGGPVIRMLDPLGIYPTVDRFGRVTSIFQRMQKPADDLAAMYPEWASVLITPLHGGDSMLEVVRYHDKDWDVLFVPSRDNLVLDRAPNPLGRVMVRYETRASIDDVPHGQFDDVLAVQVAKARFALLGLEAATKSVQAPLAVPQDVQELALGPDATMRSATPEKIRRVELSIPQGTFAQQQLLDQEIRQGSRYPEVRGGNTDASIITGRGVQALMSGFDTQIKAAQALFARMFTELIGLCFAVDESVYGDQSKTVRGNDNGNPYEITYKPERDIHGDHTVDVQYGLMAGLDPNRALVFALQARGDKLISRNWVMRQLPFSVNASEQETQIDVEEMRDALKQAMAAYAQSIPAMVQQGMNAEDALEKLASVIAGRQKGRPIELLVQEAFAPEEPEGSPEGVADDMGLMPDEGVPGAAPSGAMSMMQGMSGGRPDLQTLLASLGSNGQPNLSAGVSRRIPV